MISQIKITSIVFGVLFALSFTSCEKTYQSELIGTWQLETLGDSILEVYKPSWTFYDDNRVVITNAPEFGVKGSVSGYYSVDSKWVVTPIIFIQGFGEGIDGNYQADELNESILKMSRYEYLDSTGNFIEAGANLRKEFYK